MRLQKDDIILRKAILHILDAHSGYLRLSDQLFNMGVDFSESVRKHLYKMLSGDSAVPIDLTRAKGENVQLLILLDDTREDFIPKTKQLAENLFDIMCDSVEIPPADLLCVSFQLESEQYVALLKMNYKESYVHQEVEDFSNNIAKRQILSPSTLQEAMIVNTGTKQLFLLEKKFQMLNGDRIFYLSERFLLLLRGKSPKEKFQFLNRAILQILNHNPQEDLKTRIEKRRTLLDFYEEKRTFNIHDIGDSLFESNADQKKEYDKKMELADISYDEFSIEEESTLKKISYIHLVTDEGIEIKIPTDQSKKLKTSRSIADGYTITLDEIENIRFK